MIDLPVADPGRPDTRSPFRLLLWVGSHQKWTLTVAISFGIVWMVAQALMPYAIGQAIQQGVDLSALPLSTLQGFHASIDKDVFEVLSLRGSLNARNVLGGTAPEQVRTQLARHRARLS